jgi:hypothetical protein
VLKFLASRFRIFVPRAGVDTDNLEAGNQVLEEEKVEFIIKEESTVLEE